MPNYWLNRSWTWQRRGRPSLRHEVLPYVAIVLATLLLAAVVTSRRRRVAAWPRRVGHGANGAVAGAFLSVYVLMFVVRYLFFDRLFRPRPEAESCGPGRV